MQSGSAVSWPSAHGHTASGVVTQLVGDDAAWVALPFGTTVLIYRNRLTVRSTS